MPLVILQLLRDQPLVNQQEPKWNLMPVSIQPFKFVRLQPRFNLEQVLIIFSLVFYQGHLLKYFLYRRHLQVSFLGLAFLILVQHFTLIAIQFILEVFLRLLLLKHLLWFFSWKPPKHWYDRIDQLILLCQRSIYFSFG